MFYPFYLVSYGKDKDRTAYPHTHHQRVTIPSSSHVALALFLGQLGNQSVRREVYLRQQKVYLLLTSSGGGVAILSG